MDEFVIKKRKVLLSKSERYKSINIWPETFEKLSKIRKQTGRGMGYIISEMTDFCLERLKVVSWNGEHYD